MKDKIREILFSDLMISGKAIDAIYQATRLDEEKMHILIFKHTEQMLDNPDDDGIYPTTKFFNNLKKAICSKQDELTKEWGYER